jgi:integrase
MQYLTPTDLAKLLRVIRAENPTHHLIAATQFFTGARIQQVLNLKGEDIIEVNGRMSVKIHAAKRGLERFHPIHFDSRPEFDMSPLLEKSKQPFALIFGGATARYFNRCLREKYCPLAGLHSDFGHSHVFRHSAAMVIWDYTKRPGAISHFLQHKSPQTAMCYLQEGDGRLAQEAMDALVLQ